MKKLSEIPAVRFKLIPPPPCYGDEYAKVIDILLRQERPNLESQHIYRGRTLYTYGWTGCSLNKHEAKDGRWTRDGLVVIKKFLVECWQTKWPFLVPGGAEDLDHARLPLPPPPDFDADRDSPRAAPRRVPPRAPAGIHRRLPPRPLARYTRRYYDPSPRRRDDDRRPHR